MDFIKIKKIIIFVLALPALYLIASNMSLIFNRPDIKNLNVPFGFKLSIFCAVVLQETTVTLQLKSEKYLNIFFLIP